MVWQIRSCYTLNASNYGKIFSTKTFLEWLVSSDPWSWWLHPWLDQFLSEDWSWISWQFGHCDRMDIVTGFILVWLLTIVLMMVISSTGQRPASYCHGVVSVVHPSVGPIIHECVCKLFLLKTSPEKLSSRFLQNFTGMFLRWSSFKFLHMNVFHEEFWLPWQPK